MISISVARYEMRFIDSLRQQILPNRKWENSGLFWVTMMRYWYIICYSAFQWPEGLLIWSFGSSIYSLRIQLSPFEEWRHVIKRKAPRQQLCWCKTCQNTPQRTREEQTAWSGICQCPFCWTCLKMQLVMILHSCWLVSAVWHLSQEMFQNKTAILNPGMIHEWLVFAHIVIDDTCWHNATSIFIEGSLNRNFRQYGESKSSRAARSVDRRCNSQKVRWKKIHPREMLEKSRNAVFFQWSVGQVSRKVGPLKRRVRRLAFWRESKNCTRLWRNAHCEVKMNKTPQVRSTFWSWDVEKLHAAVAKRTFASQNVQNTSASEHFLKFRCRKTACRCGETHICKSKCTKHLMLGPLFEVEMSKNCTPLWRNAHSQVKMLKNWRSRSTFWSSDVEKLHAAVAKRTFDSENVQNTCVFAHFLKFRCRKSVS